MISYLSLGIRIGGHFITPLYTNVAKAGGLQSMASLSRKLGISSTAVSQSVVRGEKIALKNNFELMSD